MPMTELVVARPQRWDMPFSDDMTDADVRRVLSVPPFADIDRDAFRGPISLEGILKNDARLRTYRQGDIIVRKGDWGNSAFFILSGAVRVEIEPPESSLPLETLGRRKPQKKSFFQAIAQLWSNHREPEFRDLAEGRLHGGVGTRGSGDQTRIFLQDVPRVLNQYRTVQLAAGEFFGEVAALGRLPRTATVFAEGDAELLEIRWQGLRDITRKDRSIRQHIDQMFRARALKGILNNSPMFSHASDADLETLTREAQFETFGAYDSAQPFRELAQAGADSGLKHEPVVAAEGDYPNGAILICSGLARLSRRHNHGHQTVSYLTPGHAYGLREIAEAWRTGQHVPLRYSLRAIGYLTVVIVPTRLVEQLVLEPGNAPPEPQPPPLRRSRNAPKIDEGLLEFIVDARYVQGTATMIIDMDRCTRCDDCVRACATAHDGNPRFLRHGPIYDRYMFANACMHCADPVCMIECPTGAIHRDLVEGQVVINEQTCIGCSACAQNCPFDAIRMVEIRDAAGRFIRDQRTQLPLVQATKCDLCAEQRGGPSCQNACPHDALVRVSLTDGSRLGDVFQ